MLINPKILKRKKRRTKILCTKEEINYVGKAESLSFSTEEIPLDTIGDSFDEDNKK